MNKLIICHRNLPDWHHSEGDILGTHIICTLNFVNLISFSHNYTMMLQHNSIRINSSLKIKIKLKSFRS